MGGLTFSMLLLGDNRVFSTGGWGEFLPYWPKFAQTSADSPQQRLIPIQPTKFNFSIANIFYSIV